MAPLKREDAPGQINDVGCEVPKAFETTIDADVGPRTLMQVLQRTRLHSSFHLRQVSAFLEAGGVEPEAPLSLEDLQEMGMEDLPDDIDIRPPNME